MRLLQTVAADAGVELPAGYVLTGVMAASADGTLIAGTATTDLGIQVSFALEMPLSAYGL